MKKILLAVSVSGLFAVAQPAFAASYTFSVLYSGSNVAALAAGSDNPVGTTMWNGDSFAWDMKAQSGGYWDVVTGNGFFPLMAFPVDESGTRIGDFTLTLLEGGVSVFTTSEVGASNSWVHLGTNTVTLSAGLKFDEMHLSYSLTSAVDQVDPTLSIGSTPNSLMGWPGVGPENNPWYPGIAYVVPEPATYALMLGGLGVLGFVARRKQG